MDKAVERVLAVIANSVRTRRLQVGLSQETLGRRIGLHRNTIRQFEQALIVPTVGTFSSLLMYLGVERVQLHDDHPIVVFAAGTELSCGSVPRIDELTRRLGQAVASRRIAHGLSQEELAERSEIHPTTIGHLERGEVHVELSTLIRVYHALGVREVTTVEGELLLT